MPSRSSEIDVERHDGEESPVCVGQWCCGCQEHPSGKPWGWNCEAWERHYVEHHPEGALLLSLRYGVQR